MASYFKPLRGTYQEAKTALTATPLRNGEIFFETQPGGGKYGHGKIKMGDGRSGYDDLEYFLTYPTGDTTVVDFTNTTVDVNTLDTNDRTDIPAIAPGSTLNVLISKIKKVIVNHSQSIKNLKDYDTQNTQNLNTINNNITDLNNNKLNKSGDEMTGILRLYSGGTSATKSNITFSKYRTGTKILQQGNDTGDFTITMPGEDGTLDTKERVDTELAKKLNVDRPVAKSSFAITDLDNNRALTITLDGTGVCAYHFNMEHWGVSPVVNVATREWVDNYYAKKSSSSRTVKKNIEDISLDEALKVLQLNPVKFDYKSSDKDIQAERGLIAEDVKEILPNLVEETGRKEDPYTLNYVQIIPYLIKVIQNQQKILEENGLIK